MWKYLFKPYYSVFEIVVLMYSYLIMTSFSFWLGISILPITVIIQIIATHVINKQESTNRETVI